MRSNLKSNFEHLPGPGIYNGVVPWEQLYSVLGKDKKGEALVHRAYDYAKKAHQDQKRISGAPYFCHVSRVGLSLARLGLDYSSVAAALLHDTVEDTKVSLEDLKKEFGSEIASLVDGVTKISTEVSKSKEDHQAENLRKMMIAMAKDIRVLLIKLADRLHNIRTLDFLPLEKQRRIARETLDVYAPLSHRLGIARWKWELEDRCMAILYPAEFKELSSRIKSSQGDLEGRLHDAANTLKKVLAKEDVEVVEIGGRTKHYWSIYQKILREHKKFEDIYDLVALRVIAKNSADCYGIMGAVHGVWKPVPGRVKDYIAIPKTNMYQSLHTTVIGPEGLPLEIQVRTEDMHRTAEEGIAAHWAYKEAETGTPVAELPFLKNLLEWQRESKDTRDFMEFLSIDLYDEEVFVFTPQGEVKVLPANSNAIDFAYAVHSKVGDHCYGVLINGKMSPLRQALKSGDIVRVLTAPGHKPSKDWLHIVQTNKAKNRIRHRLKFEQKFVDINRGKEVLTREFKRKKINIKDLYKSSKMTDLAKVFHFKEVDDLLAALGARTLTPRQVSEKIKKPEATPLPAPKPKVRGAHAASEDRGVEVKGVSDVVVQFARCCTPIYGDPVIGYVTVGRGVSVHRADCTNISDLLQRIDRVVEVRWVGVHSELRPVELDVAAFDREGLMADMLAAISGTMHNGTRTAITGATAQTLPGKIATAGFTIQIESLEHLKRIMLNLYQVEGVSSVKRKEKRVRRRGKESDEVEEKNNESEKVSNFKE